LRNVSARDAADVTDREAATYWGGAPERYIKTHSSSIGEKAIAFYFGLEPFVTLVALPTRLRCITHTGGTPLFIPPRA